MIGDTVLERISQFTHFVANESGNTTVMCVELFSNPGAGLPNRYACRVCGTVFCPHPALLCLLLATEQRRQHWSRIWKTSQLSVKNTLNTCQINHFLPSNLLHYVFTRSAANFSKFFTTMRTDISTHREVLKLESSRFKTNRQTL